MLGGRFARALLPGARDHLGEPPVHDLDLAVGADHDVLGLEVAVDDAALVCEEDRAGDLDEHLEEPEERELAHGLRLARPHIPHDLGERSPADELHREEEAPLVVEADLVDRNDSRVLELGRGLRLLDEARRELLVDPEVVEEDLHGDPAA